MEDKALPVTGHLAELRIHIIKSVVCILGCAVVLYNFSGQLVSFLARPVGQLVFITPTEAFVTNIKIALWGGLFISSPYVIYQIWQFVAAALKRQEKKYIFLFGPVSFIFFVLGGLFGFFVVVPVGITFLLHFATDIVHPMISVSHYISFIGILIFAFGLVFQLPLVLLFLTKMGMVTPQILGQKRRVAIVLMFICAAAITPPDVVTQVSLAIPLLLLYELGILFSKLAYSPTRDKV